MDERLKKTGARLKSIRVAKGISRAEVAKAAGISYDYLAKMENGQRRPNIEVLSEVLEALGTGLDEFFGDFDDFSPPDHGAPFPVEKWGLTRLGAARAIPLIGWAQAGQWAHVPEGQGAPEGDVVWSDAVPEGCYALRVEGDSMRPEFEPGDIIVVDPGLQPDPGDYVVARVEGESEAVFKQYRIDAGRPVLHALNNEYPDIKLGGPFETVAAGVVVECKRMLDSPDKRAALMADIIQKLPDLSEEQLQKLAAAIPPKNETE